MLANGSPTCWRACVGRPAVVRTDGADGAGERAAEQEEMEDCNVLRIACPCCCGFGRVACALREDTGDAGGGEQWEGFLTWDLVDAYFGEIVRDVAYGMI